MAGTLHAGRRGRLRPIAEINVTPLVDVMLVLLVILMVSSTYIVAQTLKVQLPKTSSTDGRADQPVTMTLLKGGGLLWNDEPITEDKLAARIQEAVRADPELSLVVSADREVPHGQVVHALDLAKLAGVRKFAINVQVE
jgi:biopolymer transport protein ExbD